MIQGVETKQLNSICDERGRLMEIMRCDDEGFSGSYLIQLLCTQEELCVITSITGNSKHN